MPGVFIVSLSTTNHKPSKFVKIGLKTESARFFPRPKKILWTIYSATSIFAVCRNLVPEIWFEKYGSRKVVREKWLTRKKVVL